MKNLIIFGASGFLGNHLLEELASQDVTIYAITRKLTEKLQKEAPQNVRWLEADLYHAEEWNHLITNCDYVVDLVGIVNENKAAGLTYEHVIFEAAKVIADSIENDKSKTFIYVSTNLKTNQTPDKYRAIKKETEDYLLSQDFDTVILRPGFMYGSDRPEKQEIAEKILSQLKVGKPGWKSRPIQVNSVAKTITSIITKGATKQIYEIDDME